MFLDINGNTFSTLGNRNKVPAFDLNPQQIYGDKLFAWVDFGDKSTLYTDTAFTTNVTADGNYIRAFRDKSLRNTSFKITTTQCEFDYIYSSITGFNNRGGIYRVLPQSATSINPGFQHSVNFLPTNTNYTIHAVVRPQSSNSSAGLYIVNSLAGFFLNGNNYVIATNANQQTPIFNLTNPGLTNLSILSATFDFTTDYFHTIKNNELSFNQSSTTIMSYTGSLPLSFFVRGGTTTTYVSAEQGFYCQEMIFVTGMSTTEELNLTHQYLRLKYL